MANEPRGVVIETGASDWQIFQQDKDGLATVKLSGRWFMSEKGVVQVRVGDEATGVSTNRELDWHAVTTNADGTWSTTLRVPAGGLYRLETRYKADTNPAGEWSTRGDMRHFWGVGDLWVITGQSNSAGFGRGPASDPPELGVHILRDSETWALATHPLNDSTDTRHAVNREEANSGVSPYLHFGRLLKHELGYPIGLIQAALGGSALSAWNPVEKEHAELYENMMHCIELAGGQVRGALWYQGETDSNPTLGPTYAKRFIDMVKAWRKALHSPRLPLITVQLNRALQPFSEDSFQGWSIVREAQRQLPHKLPGVLVVPALDLALSDGVHNSPVSNLLLADRLARAALGGVYGRPVDYLAPELSSARCGADATSIDLAFDNVTSRMGNTDPTAIAFRVTDRQGDVPIKSLAYPNDNRVRLMLDRPLVGAATVDGAPGFDPPTVPMDVERFLPMLAFHGAKVTRA